MASSELAETVDSFESVEEVQVVAPAVLPTLQTGASNWSVTAPLAVPVFDRRLEVAAEDWLSPTQGAV